VAIYYTIDETGYAYLFQAFYGGKDAAVENLDSVLDLGGDLLRFL
jgi:hypothetical protein